MFLCNNEHVTCINMIIKIGESVKLVTNTNLKT